MRKLAIVTLLAGGVAAWWWSRGGDARRAAPDAATTSRAERLIRELAASPAPKHWLVQRGDGAAMAARATMPQAGPLRVERIGDELVLTDRAWELVVRPRAVTSMHCRYVPIEGGAGGSLLLEGHAPHGDAPGELAAQVVVFFPDVHALHAVCERFHVPYYPV